MICELNLVITLPPGDDGYPVPKVRVTMAVMDSTVNPYNEEEALVLEGYCEEVRKLRATHGEIVIRVAPGGPYSSYKIVGHGAWLEVIKPQDGWKPDSTAPLLFWSTQDFGEAYAAQRGTGLPDGKPRAATLDWDDIHRVCIIGIGELGAGMTIARDGVTLRPDELAIPVTSAPWPEVQADRHRHIRKILDAVGYREISE
jgi:hypothetical protein